MSKEPWLFLRRAWSDFLALAPWRRREAFCPEQIYYINLDQRPDRREFMEEQLGKLGIPFVRWPAVWLSDLNEAAGVAGFNIERVGPRVLAKDNILGIVGCYLSHLGVLRHIANTGSKQTLVFEDDIVIDAGFLNAVHEIVRTIADFDIVLIDCFGPRFARDRITDAVYRPSRSFPEYWGAHAYVIGRGKARRVLNALEELGIKDIDGLYLGYWGVRSRGIRCYVIYPGKLTQGRFGSDRMTKGSDRRA